MSFSLFSCSEITKYNKITIALLTFGIISELHVENEVNDTIYILLVNLIDKYL